MLKDHQGQCLLSRTVIFEFIVLNEEHFDVIIRWLAPRTVNESHFKRFKVCVNHTIDPSIHASVGL